MVTLTIISLHVLNLIYYIKHYNLLKCLFSAPPSFIIKPQNKTVPVGRRISFRCEVIGNPMPAVFWNKDGTQVRN